MRENGFRAIGGLAQRLASGVAQGREGKGGKSRGVSVARLKAEWSVIVGQDLARATQPEALLPGRGGKSGKALRLRVAGAAALEVQHSSGVLVERVNAYFGHKFIDEIRLVQGDIARPAAAPRPLPAPDPQLAQRITAKVAEVKDPELRAALARLGTRIASGRRAIVLGLLGTVAIARPPRAQAPDTDKLLAVMPGDHVLGKANAPNIIIDYFSLTCPHCANFHAAVLPQVKRDWIDNGRARFVYRHYPSDSIATHASQLSECGGAAGFYATIDLLFRTQVDWLTAPDPDSEMVKVAEKAGIAAAGRCLADDRLLDKIVADVQSGQALKVRATPTLFINSQFYGNPAGGAEGINAILAQVGR
jgi:protein-disulfide isomerase